jgi:hypothetical protein
MAEANAPSEAMNPLPAGTTTPGDTDVLCIRDPQERAQAPRHEGEGHRVFGTLYFGLYARKA